MEVNLSQLRTYEGELIKCSDPAIAEFVKKLNEDTKQPKSGRAPFIIQSYPEEVSFFVEKNTSSYLREEINELINQNTFSPENKK